MGRPAQPTALKLARGNPHGHKLNDREPNLPDPSLEVPDGMTGKAKQEWLRLISVVIDSGMVTVGDADAFEEYCYLVADVQDYRRLIRRIGRPKSHALGYVNTLNKLRSQKRMQAAHLGLTPTSRSSVKAVKAPADPKQAQRNRFFGVRKESPA